MRAIQCTLGATSLQEGFCVSECFKYNLACLRYCWALDLATRFETRCYTEEFGMYPQLPFAGVVIHRLWRRNHLEDSANDFCLLSRLSFLQNLDECCTSSETFL